MKNSNHWLRRAATSLALAFAASAPAFADPAVQLSYVRNATTVDVSVSAQDVTDLYAYQFSLNFDPGVLAAIDATEGSFLGAGGSTYFWPGSVDNFAGQVSFAFDTLVGPGAGVSGSGLLATFSFSILAPDSTAITLTDLLGFDSQLNGLALSAPGTLAIAAAVPEPGTFGLLAVGGLAIAFGARGRRRPVPRPVPSSALARQ